MREEIKLQPHDVDYIVKTMTLAIGALSTMGAAGNRVELLLSHIEKSIEKLTDPNGEEERRKLMELIARTPY